MENFVFADCKKHPKIWLAHKKIFSTSPKVSLFPEEDCGLCGLSASTEMLLQIAVGSHPVSLSLSPNSHAHLNLLWQKGRSSQSFIPAYNSHRERNNTILKSTGPSNKRNRYTNTEDADKPSGVSTITGQTENNHKLKQEISEPHRRNGELSERKPRGCLLHSCLFFHLGF